MKRARERGRKRKGRRNKRETKRKAGASKTTTRETERKQKNRKAKKQGEERYQRHVSAGRATTPRIMKWHDLIPLAQSVCVFYSTSPWKAKKCGKPHPADPNHTTPREPNLLSSHLSSGSNRTVSLLILMLRY